MKESVALAKDADAKKDFLSTRSGNSIRRVRNEPEKQLGSLRGVIGNIRHDGGTPSVDSIATELSSMHTAQRAPVLLALQRTHGNRYVQRVVAGIQAKLKVGQPGDKYEQEADRVADEVMRMPEPRVQRQTEEEEEEEEILQTKENPGLTPEVTPDFESRIPSLKGGGQPLPEANRGFMERRFGIDFSGVRLHTDSDAAQMSRELNAEAFTYGRDIYFGAGRYSPGTLSGKRLLAHELTHVVQQQSMEGTIRCFPADEDECPGYQPGEISTSRTASGHLDPDVTLHAPSRLLIADFGVGRQSVKPSTQAEPLLRSWLSIFESDNSYKLSIAGYSDCVGSDSVNTRIRHERAEQVERLLRPGARSRVTFRGMAGLGDYVTNNNTIENRAKNRGVIIEFHQEITFPPEIISIPPPHGYSRSKAASYARTYARSPNPAYHEYPNDCTNFVSQALYKGGWTMIGGSCADRQNNDVWWYGKCWWPRVYASYTWAGAENFSRFIALSGRGSPAPDVMSLDIGDVLQMNFSGGTTKEHTMIVTRKSSTNIYLSYHTVNRLDEPFNDEAGRSGIYTRYPRAKYFPWWL